MERKVLMRTRFYNKNEYGFTLVEILVVILIVGILASIAIPVFLNQRQKANDAALTSDVVNAAKVVETYLGSGGKTSELYTKAGNKNTIVFEGAGVNLYAGTTPRWNTIVPAGKANMSSGAFIDMRVYPSAVSTWDAHSEGEYCLAGGHLNSGKYNYLGGNQLKYGDLLYYDVALGGITDFSKIVAAVKAGNKTSCSGFGRSYIAAGGV
jgi:type IV pilus assembly protein PilA